MYIFLSLFLIFIIGMLLLDLGVFHKKSHIISTKEALTWTVIWVVLSFLFNIAIYYIYENKWLDIGTSLNLSGKDAFLQFLSGYIVEKALSLDNILVIALIFSYFQIPQQYQHRALFWGIIFALFLRGIMICLGSVLIEKFSWMTYVFGGLLLITAIKLLLSTSSEPVHPDKNIFVRICRKFYPVYPHTENEKFFVKSNAQTLVTPLFLSLLVIESSDVMFAFDSIPAIFAITKEPLIVFTSNIFAILGLRSLYFVLANMISKFKYMTMSLVIVLGFVGIKLILEHHVEISIGLSLIVVSAILIFGVILSIFKKD